MKVSSKYPLSCRLKKKKIKLKITILSKTEELLSNFKLLQPRVSKAWTEVGRKQRIDLCSS